MSNGLQLGFQRLGNTTVLVIDDSMLKDSSAGIIRNHFFQFGFFLPSLHGSMTTMHNNLLGAHLPNSPAVDTMHVVREGDFQVCLSARMLTFISVQDALVLKTAIEVASDVFMPCLTFHGAAAGAFTNEEAHIQLWKKVAEIHGARKTWYAYKNMFLAYCKYVFGYDTLGQRFKSFVAGCNMLTNLVGNQNIRKAIFSAN